MFALTSCDSLSNKIYHGKNGRLKCSSTIWHLALLGVSGGQYVALKKWFKWYRTPDFVTFLTEQTHVI